MDFIVITGLALIFLALSWLYGRILSGGRPLNSFNRRMLGYSFAFALGMGYVMLFVADFHLSKELLAPMIAGWAGVIAFVGWARHRRKKRSSPSEASDFPHPT
jgi:hypothetical protein